MQKELYCVLHLYHLGCIDWLNVGTLKEHAL